MIRVKIAGEEVLSNKDFTITEELLKTSSTILDNVYPKSWEETHDYVNNFYFPKDYSSCTIENVEPITPIIGTRVSGSNMSINYDNTLSWDLEQLKGNTTQQTYTGKNLIPSEISSQTISGLTVTKYSDGSFLLNGKTTATISRLWLFENKNIPLSAGTYTLSTNSTGTVNDTVYFVLKNTSNVEMPFTVNLKTQKYKTTTLNNSVNILQGYLYIGTGITFTNYRIYPMFTKENSMSSYEPYVGGIPSPNPSYPQAINNVTGRQEIDIVGKNLANIENIKIGKSWNNGNYGQRATILYIPVKTNTQYTLVSSWTNENITNIRAVFNHGASDTTNYNIPSGYPYNNAQWEYVSIEVIANTTFTSTMLDGVKIMLCEGEASIDDYEPYIGKQYEINLGKNLCNITSEQRLHYSSGLPTDSSDTIFIDSYDSNNVSFYTTSANYNIVLSNIIQLQPNTTYTIKFDRTTTSTNNQWFIYDYNGSYSINFRDNNTNILEKTFTTNNVGKIALAFGHGNTTGQTEITNIQLEKGSQATTYSPYKTPIELCKIGDYQDYIYKNNNKWYIHKEIGKVVLDGSENWQGGGSASTQGYKYYYCTGYSQTPISFDIYCDKLNPYTQAALGSTITVSTSTIGSQTSASNNLRVIFDNNIANSLADFKTWLTNNKPEVYYILANSTDTEITDTELIEQLNAVELLNGINNISTISPNENGELQIYYNYRDAGEDINLIFAGLVKNSGSISLRPTDPKYCSLQILDYKTLLSEGQTLDYVINNKTIKEAIQMVINSVTSYGFIEGNIDIDAANDVIGAYSTLNKTPYDVFQYLADISQSKWFTRVIDEKTIAIDFYDPNKLPKADDIEYTEEYFKDNKIIDINYSFSGSDYRNKQTILSEKIYGNVAINDIITCNGYEQTFTTSQIIGEVKSIKVNNVEKTFATNTEKGLGIIADFYYSPNGNSFESNDLYDAGDKIIISYMPIVKGRRVISNDDEISRINQQINRNGIISRYEERNDIVDGDELSKVAEAYIKYKGTAEIKLNVLTENKDLFNIGQQVYFDMPNVEDLATDYMVKKKQIEIIQTGDYKNIFYTYELTSNFNSETDINFFDNQRRKAEGNISEDQFITRNVDINNSTNIIFDNLQVIEVQTTDNNTLNCALNSPFIN